MLDKVTNLFRETGISHRRMHSIRSHTAKVLVPRDLESVRLLEIHTQQKLDSRTKSLPYRIFHSGPWIRGPGDCSEPVCEIISSTIEAKEYEPLVRTCY